MQDNAGKEKEPKSSPDLPSGYQKLMVINLQKDKKKALLINAAAILIMVVMVLIGIFWLPIGAVSKNLLENLPHLYLMFFGYLLYILLHEWVHGVVMNYFVKGHVKYGFTGLYAYAGSDAYYNKHDYLIIALAPIVFWGAVLLIFQLIVPISWKWVVYAIQIGNISGGAGDLYTTWKMIKLPSDLLVQDSGVEMTVYTPEAKTAD